MIEPARMRRTLLGLLLTAAVGCGGPGDLFRAFGTHEQGDAKLGGDVVSTVDGVAIQVSDVQRVVTNGGLPPKEALRRLQSELLLAGEAARRGYAKRADVSQVATQASVQALLAHVVESSRSSEAEIAAAYAAQQTRFHVPERRRCAHLLALVPEHASPKLEQMAHELIEHASRELSLRADPHAELATLQAEAQPPLMAKVEELPATAADGGFVKPFLDALFALPGVGSVSPPVRTTFGWHVIVLEEIEPASQVSLDEARPTLQRELEVDKHKQQLDRMLAELRAGTTVSYDAKGQKALAAVEP